MKRLLLIFALCCPAWATTYYVDNCVVTGSDSNNGTATGTPWLTIAKVNGFTFAAGDSILFQRTCTWNEQLTVPRSGDATHIMTFGDYGSGALPIISGANALTSFTSEATGTPNYTADANMQAYWYFEQNANDGTANTNTLTDHGTVTYSTTHQQGSYSASFASASTQYFSRTDANLNTAFPGKNGQTTTAMWAGAWIHTASQNSVVLSKGNWSLRLSGHNLAIDWNDGSSHTIYSDAAIDDGAWHHVDLGWNGTTLTMYVDCTAQSTPLTTSSFVSSSGELDIGKRNSSYMNGLIDEAFVFNRAPAAGECANIVASGLAGTPGTIYYKVASTAPNQVFRDGARLALAASKVALATGKFWWDSGNTRVYVFDNPSGHDTEASQRSYAVTTNNKNYLAVSNLTLLYANSYGLYATSSNSAFSGISSTYNYTNGIAIINASTTSFSNTDASHNGTWGFNFNSGDSNITCTNCTASYNFDDGLLFDAVVTATVTGGSANNNGTASNQGNGIDVLQESSGIANSNITITGFSSHDNYGNGIDVISALLGDTGNLNVILQNSLFYNNHTSGGSLSSGIRFDDNTFNSIIRYNQSYSNDSAGIVVEAQAHDNIVEYNQVWSNNNGITTGGDSGAGGANNVFYGNVSYANTTDGFQIATKSSPSTFKNNISYLNGRYGYNTDGSQTDVIDYNVMFGNVTSNYHNISKPTHDINSDPLFTNAAGLVFTLQAGSPAINAGMNPGSTYQNALDPRFTFPQPTINQNGNGSGWEIGAFVFIENCGACNISMLPGVMLAGASIH